jgi:hypothetical protein
MSSPIDYLIFTQHETGGWGYSKNNKPVVEATSVALLAIRNEPSAESSFQKGITWLINSQHEDGGWGIYEDDPESGWQTAWALITLRYSNQKSNSITRAEDWLTYVGTSYISSEELQNTDITLYDNSGALVWPWMPDQVCWIEPTALTVLAIENLSQSSLASTRLKAALEYFKLNRTPSGGWDVGNASALDTIIIPRAYPTSLVLMALARTSPQDIKTIDISALQQDLLQDTSVLIQSAGLLAVRILGGRGENIISVLKELQLPNGSWDNNPYFTAWASIGLRGYL